MFDRLTDDVGREPAEALAIARLADDERVETLHAYGRRLVSGAPADPGPADLLVVIEESPGTSGARG